MVGNIKVYTDEFIENEARELLKWIEDENNVYLTNFCVKRKFPECYLYEWANNNLAFSEAYKFAKTCQRARLVNGGLYEHTNPGFTKFVLVNNHKEYYKPESQITAEEVAQAVVTAVDYKNALDKDKGWQKPTGQETTS